MPAIEVHELHKAYGEIVALDGVSFSVEAGETVGILGPNGAGKTTAIEILEGYRHRDRGSVSVLGVDPDSGDRAWRTAMGVVLQSSAVEDELTVRETLEHLARFYPDARSPQEAMILTGLEGTADQRIKTLSGGQRRRLDLALGVLGRPRLLFLDEPTTGFDPAARRAAWETIAGLGHDGTTILLTTHYLDEARRLADRLLVLAAGRVVAEGDPDTLGGRHRAVATITFRTSDGLEPPGAARDPGGGWRIAAPDPVPVLHELTAWSLDHDVALEGLEVARPTLEDVYLDLVGAGEGS